VRLLTQKSNSDPSIRRRTLKVTQKFKVSANLPAVTEALEAARGPQGLDGFVFREVLTVLMTGFPLDPDLAEAERSQAIGAGIHRAASVGPFTPRSLEAAIRQEESRLLTAPQRSCTMASNLSFTLWGPIKPKQFGPVQLLRSPPPRILAARETQADRIDNEDRRVSAYSGCLVRVKARSPAHAFDRAINQADTLRGIWNLSLNRPIIAGESSDPTTPINRIRFSRVHTIHHANGTLATPTYWFNPEFRLQSSPSLNHDSWARTLQFQRSVQRRLPKIKYQAEIERAIIHYGRALDATDMEAAFLKLWSVLELTTGLGGERYETLTKRAAFMFQPDPMTKLVLDHLRYQRNEVAHLGYPQSEMRPLVYQLKRFVEQMIVFHLAYGHNFECLDEAGRFMDLDQSPDALRRRVALIEQALRFRHIRKPPGKKAKPARV
jgi:hypothetical protein